MQFISFGTEVQFGLALNVPLILCLGGKGKKGIFITKFRNMSLWAARKGRLELKDLQLPLAVSINYTE